jgi:multisubunit Na+/H+ antiporter MnhC subunit
MQEIDPSNIVSRRTRGRKIDFAKEAAAAGDELEDDDEEDEEYVQPLPFCLYLDAILLSFSTFILYFLGLY